MVNGDPRSLTKAKGGEALLVQPAQRPQFVALNWVRARRAVLDPADVEHGADVKSGPTSATLRFAPCRRGAYVIVGFGAGDRAMLIVLSYATMALLGGLGLLAACENIEK